MAHNAVIRILAVAIANLVGVAVIGIPAVAQTSGPGQDDDTSEPILGQYPTGNLQPVAPVMEMAALLRGTVIVQTLAGNDNEWRYSSGVIAYPDFLDVQRTGDELDPLRDENAGLGGPDTTTRLGAEVQVFMEQVNPLAELRNLFAGFKSVAGMDSETEVMDLHGYGTVGGLRDVLGFSEIKDLVMSIGAHGLGIMPGDNITQAVWKAPAGLEPPGVTDGHDRYADQEVAYATEYLAPGVYIEETSFYKDLIANTAYVDVWERHVSALMYTVWLHSQVATILTDWLDANERGFIIQKLEEGGYFKAETEGATQGAAALRSALEPWTDVAGFCGNVLDACPNIAAMFDEADAIFGKRTDLVIDVPSAGFLPTGETAMFSALFGALDSAVDALNIIIDHVGAGLLELDPELGVIILDQDGDTEVAHLRALVDREGTTRLRDDSWFDDTSRDGDRTGDDTRTTRSTAPTQLPATTVPERSTTSTTAPTRSTTTTTAPERSTTTTAPERSTTTTVPERSTTSTTAPERSTTTTITTRPTR